jgi:glycosyltransferase involved in cell wall biosynthesis
VSRLLTALRRQSVDADEFEVVVVADGCQDETAAKIRAARWPFHVNVLEQPASGAAAARNRGAQAATGELLLFLDDDVEPEADVLRAHVAAHGNSDSVVGLGRLRPAITRDDFLGVSLRGWWEDMSEAVREHGHRHSCFDLLSGHFSIRRRTFSALGGFDAALRCREDYELGYRINAQGLTFQLITGAVATHHDMSDLAKVIRRKFDEGFADVALCERHSALSRVLPLRRPPDGSRLALALYWLAWHHPSIGDVLAAGIVRMLPLYEFWRLRYRWRMRVEDLLGYWYWRGVATAAGNRGRLDLLRTKAHAPRDVCLTVDLQTGLEAAVAQLDRVRPSSVRFVYGRHLVGELPEVPGAEPLRGVHLSRIIMRQFAKQYLHVVCLSRAVPEILLNPSLEESLLAAISPAAPSDSY